jgi:phosphohistidine phosphatase
MRTLTLMRHAKSSWDDPSVSDHDRPLNGRGKKAAKTMAERLKDSGYEPDLVIVSSARRTQETAEALRKRYGKTLTIRTEPRLYEAEAEAYADVIRGVDDKIKHLMIIGHNPTVEWMAEALGGGSEGMPTAAYIRLEIPSKWGDFRFETLNVLAYDFPKSDK